MKAANDNEQYRPYRYFFYDHRSDTLARLKMVYGMYAWENAWLRIQSSYHRVDVGTKAWLLNLDHTNAEDSDIMEWRQ